MNNGSAAMESRLTKWALSEGKTVVSALLSELKHCSKSKNLVKGMNVHQAVIESGRASNLFVSSALIDMYAKCGRMGSASRVFDEMQERDVVSWTTLILGYVDNGEALKALDCFSRMRREGFSPNSRTFVAALKACSHLASQDSAANSERGKKVHMLALKCGCDSDVYVNNTLIDMYSKCGSMERSFSAFEKMQNRDVVSWNAIIYGYAEYGESEVALSLLWRMRAEGCPPNAVTFVGGLMACTALAVSEANSARPSLEKGRALHLLASASGCDSHTHVEGSLLDMYAKCRSMVDAHRVFESMNSTNAVCWNVVILGYVENGEGETALNLFARMRAHGCPPDLTTFLFAVKAFSSVAANDVSSRRRGRALHLLASRECCDSDACLKSALVKLYSKCGDMSRAHRVFDSIEHPDIVTWTVLILGYAENEKGHLSLELFARLKREGSPEPDAFTFAAVLKACGTLGALDVGKAVYGDMCSLGLKPTVFLAACLVDFYVKCGSLAEARWVFDVYPAARGEVAVWNTLMAGYGRFGDTGAVFSLFDGMHEAAVRPNAISMLCVLFACSHAGLVDKGKGVFDSMRTVYGVEHQMEHYTCMIDILSRSNRLQDAMLLLRCMPFSPIATVWLTVLGACRKFKNIELGRLAFECLTCLGERKSTAYILMANIHSNIKH